jgi:hypothetical protein
MMMMMMHHASCIVRCSIRTHWWRQLVGFDGHAAQTSQLAMLQVYARGSMGMPPALQPACAARHLVLKQQRRCRFSFRFDAFSSD